MTTRAMDHRIRSAHSIAVAVVVTSGILAAVVALAVVGGDGNGKADGAGAPPAPTPAPTAAPSDGGSDAMPIKVDLANATGADVSVDIVDGTGLLASAESGTPGDGQSVEPYRLVATNIDAKTLRLTWVDYPVDNALTLYIDESEGSVRFLLVQPPPIGTTDSIGFDRELILSFSQPISADQVETFLQEGLDTPG